MHKIIHFLLVFLAITGAQAQQTLIQRDPTQKYQLGQELFLKSLYGGAREQFESFITECPTHLLATNAQYYVGLCALYQGQPDAEYRISQFVAAHPEHSKTGEANLEMGTYYYNSKNYDKAIEFFDKVDWSSLSKAKQLEGKFRIGYSYFSKKDFTKALGYFNDSKKSNNKYQYASTYYAAYIEFKNGLYDEALADLDKAETNDEFKSLVPQLKTNVLYRKGDYDQLIKYAKPIADGTDKVLGQYEITLLLAESYFQQEKYTDSYTYFQKAERLQSGTLPRDIAYRYGYTSYKSKMWDNATKQFKPIAGNKDTIGQAAAYYLGLSYLAMEQKEAALLSFTQASSSTYLLNIKEESDFLIGKISFDLQQYTQATKQLKFFIETYPKSDHQEEAGGLLGEAFLNGKDYVAAIDYLERLKRKSIRVNTAYQKLTFYRGVELYNQSQVREAISYFQKSNANPFSKEILLESWYWMGECYSVLKEYNEAIEDYSQVLKGGTDVQSYKARYGLGYAYYNTQQYDKAIPHFKIYTDQWEEGENSNYYKDALVRLGDLYYVTKKYPQAIAYYDKAQSAHYPETDYILFQKGIVYNLSNQSAKATENFQLIITKYHSSVYYDHALFQQAQLYMEASDYEKAAKAYTSIITRNDPNGYIPYALQKRALANFNLKKYPEAKEDYKTILTRYPQHPVGESALIGLQEILALEGSSDQFDTYLSEYKTANPDQKGLKEIEYTNALAQYSNQRYEQAAKNFDQFVTKYPDHPQVGDALFYLSESNYRLKKYTEAEVGYQKVLLNKDKYYNRALGRMAEMENTKGNSAKAVEYYALLNQFATSKKDQFVAWTGLMENYYKLSQLDSSERYTNQILAHGNPVLDAQNKALLYKAKIYQQRAKYVEATDYLVQLMNSNKDAYAAEANYMLAEIQYTKKEYQQSLETLYSLNENYATYTDWVNKGFLLIAENLIATNETFQAKATLQSIIDHCKDPVVVEKAKARLEQLK
ncbi:MAG: hypothetical protein JWO58_1868 [Chitinophagaceae bacterium]|nr:hypothetical protein [Chitinophagaceae bacterium]